MSRHAIRVLALFWLAFTAQPVAAAELKLLSPGALRSTMMEVIGIFERSSGHKVRIEYGAAGQLIQRVQKGEAADVVILTRGQIDLLAKQGRLASGPYPNVAKVGIGVAVKKGAARPDISSMAKFVGALSAAKTIGYADPSSGAAGAHLAKTFVAFGLSDALKDKTRTYPPGDPLYRGFEAGEVEIGFAPISEIVARSATLDLVGPVPEELQRYNQFAAGALATGTLPDAARELITYLISSPVAKVLKAKGLEPG